MNIHTSILSKRKTLMDQTKKTSPIFVCIKKALESNINNIKESFKDETIKTNIFYPYKTNDWEEVCKIIHDNEINAEVSNLKELKQAIKLKAKKIVYNSPLKTEKDIVFISKHENIITIIDNEDEIELINNISIKEKKVLDVGVRIRFNNKKNNLSRFGTNLENLEHIINKVNKASSLKFIGIHFHIGTKITKPDFYCKRIRLISNYLRGIKKENKEKIRFIDIGGGFGISEIGTYLTLQNFIVNKINKMFNLKINFRPRIIESEIITKFGRKIVDEFKKSISDIAGLNKVELWIEPGRFLVSNTIHLLTKVRTIKEENNIILDAGSNLLGGTGLKTRIPLFDPSVITSAK